MRRAGISGGSPVVVYDDADASGAARAWWLLRYFGHPAVRVLDGGYRAWTAAGLPVTRRTRVPAPGDFTARPGGLPVLDAAAAAALARAGVLLDARAAARYRGETEPVDPVAGHIPGAVSAPRPGTPGRTAGSWTPPRSATGSPRSACPPGRERGGRGATAVGAYCGSGVTAAHEVLALALAGIPAALYPGSWSEWITSPQRPVATGPEPG